MNGNTEDARKQLAFQIAAQLPGNLEDALFVLKLAAELVEYAAKLDPQERVPPLRAVTGGLSNF